MSQSPPHALPADAPSRLVLRDLTGTERSVSDYPGRVIVVNFWATWCIPCRQEMPLLAAVQRRYAEKGVVIIGASADDESTYAQIRPFIDQLGITFPIWTGATTEHMQQLGLGTGLPVTAVIDQQGRRAFRLLGILQRKDLEQRLDFLLSGRQGPAPSELVDRISAGMANAHAHGRGQEREEHHSHGAVGLEGASTVPS